MQAQLLTRIESGGFINSSLLLNALEALRDQERINFSFYKPYPIFEEFHRLGIEAMIRLLLAANRIGKTFSALAETAMHSTLTYPKDWKGYKYKKKNMTIWIGVLRDFEAQDIEERLFDGDGEDLPFIHPSLVISRNKSKRRYKVSNSLGGITKIAIKTYDLKNKKNEDSPWKAKKVDFIMFDEQPPMHVLSEAMMRIMNTSDKDRGMIVIAATCTQYTPLVLSFTERITHVEKKIEEGITLEKKQTHCPSGEVVDGKVYLLAGWEDVTHLSEEQKLLMIENMLPHEVQARTKGMPSIGSGMVYPVLEDIYLYDSFPIPDHWPRAFGMDFGWTHNTACVFGALDRDNGVWYLYAEYANNRKTPQEHALDLMNYWTNWIPGLADPACKISQQGDGSNFMNMYRNSGMNLFIANNSVEEGTIKVLQGLRNGKIKICRTLNNLLSEIRMYARNEDGQIIKGNDHLLDAMRYLIMSGVNIAITRQEYEYSNIYFNKNKGNYQVASYV